MLRHPALGGVIVEGCGLDGRVGRRAGRVDSVKFWLIGDCHGGVGCVQLDRRVAVERHLVLAWVSQSAGLTELTVMSDDYYHRYR